MQALCDLLCETRISAASTCGRRILKEGFGQFTRRVFLAAMKRLWRCCGRECFKATFAWVMLFITINPLTDIATWRIIGPESTI